MTAAIPRRLLLKSLGAAALLASIPKPLYAQGSPSIRIQRLNWAGIRIASENIELLIDPVITDIWQGESPHPMVSPELETSRRYVLITHTHGDHFDKAGLAELLGERGLVVCHQKHAAYIASLGFKTVPVELFKPYRRGAFSFTALPASDGVGDTQVSWLIVANGKRYLHAGDTLSHGSWRDWGAFYGPFDTAFLPINGAIQADEPPSEMPLSMTPEQAVDAALMLRAKRMVPIHYGFNAPGAYEEHPDALNTLMRAAKRRNVQLEVITPGEWLTSQ